MHPIWKQHVEALASVLLAESAKASIVQHRGLRGGVREGFFRNFIEGILPETMGVATGEIFDRQERRSRQTDIIIYDKAFPTINIGSTRVFPIDAVVAAVEVKTHLDATTLKAALDNSLAISSMSVRASIMRTSSSSITPIVPTPEDWDWLYPGVYVFGYQGYANNAEPLRAAVVEWCRCNEARMLQLATNRLFLPRVIATPTTFMIRAMDDLHLGTREDNARHEYLFGTRLSGQSIAVFVADLLTKILARSDHVRLNPTSRREWVLSAADQFNIEDLVLEQGVQWHLGDIEISDQ